MAEKRADSGRLGNPEAMVRILKPFAVYYVLNFITALIMTGLVKMISEEAGGSLAQFFGEQEATVHAVIGGLAMVSGILPLLSDFRCEIYGEAGNRAGRHNRIFFTITLAIASSLAVNFFFQLFHLTESSAAYEQTAERQYGVIFPIGILLYGFVSPFAEEVVFRGILYNRLKRLFGESTVYRKPLSAVLPIVLSGLLFGIYHGNPVQMLYGFLMGMLIAYVYERCGVFFYAVLFHAAANLAVYIITGIPALYELFMTLPAGIVFAGAAVIALRWFSTGAFGHGASDRRES